MIQVYSTGKNTTNLLAEKNTLLSNTEKHHIEVVKGILACHVDDMIWGGNENFEINVIDDLKNTFMFGSEETKAFTYLGIQFIQNDDLVKPLIKTITLTAFLKSNYQMKD